MYIKEYAPVLLLLLLSTDCMDTIITDHHETLDVLPDAIAVVDAKRKDNIYPFNQLAGVGVVFKLIQKFKCYKPHNKYPCSLKHHSRQNPGCISSNQIC